MPSIQNQAKLREQIYFSCWIFWGNHPKQNTLPSVFPCLRKHLTPLSFSIRGQKSRLNGIEYLKYRKIKNNFKMQVKENLKVRVDINIKKKEKDIKAKKKINWQKITTPLRIPLVYVNTHHPKFLNYGSLSVCSRSSEVQSIHKRACTVIKIFEGKAERKVIVLVSFIFVHVPRLQVGFCLLQQLNLQNSWYTFILL